MKKIQKIILLIILVFLIGCQKGQPEKAFEFRQGYQGVVVETLKNAPPKELYENQPFLLMLKVHNLGAYGANNLKVSLEGYNKEYLKFSKEEAEISFLPGKDIFNPHGGLEVLEFKGQSYPLPSERKEKKENFIVNWHYDYQLAFSQEVCLQGSLLELASEQACQPKDLMSFSGQGSPLAVSKIEQINIPGKKASVDFRIFLANKGKGKISDLKIDFVQLGNQQITCLYPEEPKFEKEEVITCSADLLGKQSYTTILSLAASYHYQERQFLSLTIKSRKIY